MNNLYKKSIFNLLQASKNLDNDDLFLFSDKTLKLAYNLYSYAQNSNLIEQIKKVYEYLDTVARNLSGIDSEGRLKEKFRTSAIDSAYGVVSSKGNLVGPSVNTEEDAKSRIPDLENLYAALFPSVQNLQKYKDDVNLKDFAEPAVASACSNRLIYARQILDALKKNTSSQPNAQTQSPASQPAQPKDTAAKKPAAKIYWQWQNKFGKEQIINLQKALKIYSDGWWGDTTNTAISNYMKSNKLTSIDDAVNRLLNPQAVSDQQVNSQQQTSSADQNTQQSNQQPAQQTNSQNQAPSNPIVLDANLNYNFRTILGQLNQLVDNSSVLNIPQEEVNKYAGQLKALSSAFGNAIIMENGQYTNKLDSSKFLAAIGQAKQLLTAIPQGSALNNLFNTFISQNFEPISQNINAMLSQQQSQQSQQSQGNLVAISKDQEGDKILAFIGNLPKEISDLGNKYLPTYREDITQIYAALTRCLQNYNLRQIDAASYNYVVQYTGDLINKIQNDPSINSVTKNYVSSRYSQMMPLRDYFNSILSNSQQVNQANT